MFKFYENKTIVEENGINESPSIFGRFFSNFYFWAAVVFVVWVAFFDSNNLIDQYKLKKRLIDLEAQKEFYEEQIKEVAREKEELSSDPAMLEKYAREKYLYKRKGETIFYVDEEALADEEENEGD